MQSVMNNLIKIMVIVEVYSSSKIICSIILYNSYRVKTKQFINLKKHEIIVLFGILLTETLNTKNN